MNYRITKFSTLMKRLEEAKTGDELLNVIAMYQEENL